MMFKTIRNKNNTTRSNKAQVILEFTFCMIVILIMLYGITKVFLWTGKDLVDRRIAHDEVLLNNVRPLDQIDPSFHVPEEIDAVWDGN